MCARADRRARVGARLCAYRQARRRTYKEPSHQRLRTRQLETRATRRHDHARRVVGASTRTRRWTRSNSRSQARTRTCRPPKRAFAPPAQPWRSIVRASSRSSARAAAYSRARSSENVLHKSTAGLTLNDYLVQADASWEPDLWGRVSRSVEGAKAEAQASAADAQAVLLSMQAELATDYFELRGLDQERQLLDETIRGLQEAARSDAAPLRRRHRHRRRCRAGADATEDHAGASDRPRRAARATRTRDRDPDRPAAFHVLAAGRAARGGAGRGGGGRAVQRCSNAALTLRRRNGTSPI